jgi:hypothetical protein
MALMFQVYAPVVLSPTKIPFCSTVDGVPLIERSCCEIEAVPDLTSWEWCCEAAPLARRSWWGHSSVRITSAAISVSILNGSRRGQWMLCTYLEHQVVEQKSKRREGKFMRRTESKRQLPQPRSSPVLHQGLDMV